jgi:hypothetical protein
MKLKKINKALLINEAIKKANIDVSNLSPNTTVNLVDGLLIFDKPKKCFISAKNENEQEYYYLRFGDVIQEGDEYCSFSTNEWIKQVDYIGFDFGIMFVPHRRKINKPNPPLQYKIPEDGC